MSFQSSSIRSFGLRNSFHGVLIYGGPVEVLVWDWEDVSAFSFNFLPFIFSTAKLRIRYISNSVLGGKRIFGFGRR